LFAALGSATLRRGMEVGMGRIVTFAQQKGGAGKTTLALNLACAAAESGLPVAILDADPQGSLGQWFMLRRERGEPGLTFATASAWGVSYECEKLAKDHGLVVVDTPPKVDADLRPALRASDLVVVPVATSHLDLWATESVLDLARREGRDVLVVLNRLPPRARIADEMAKAVDGLAVDRARSVIGNRVAFAAATGRGLSVLETDSRGKAAADVRALWSEVRLRLG
jgi:chromosome partitioning protein